jgi:hypothetical protein
LTSSKNLDPATPSLDDARALSSEQNLPAEIAAQVVPGLCRIAVEAAFVEAARRRGLESGSSHAEFEARLDEANTLTKKASYALFGDLSRGGDVLGRLNSWGRQAGDAYQAINKGVHQGNGDLHGLVDEATWLVTRIKGSRW